MELCSVKHEEICYEGRYCPACEEINNLQAEIENSIKQIADLENEIEGLKNEIQTK